MTLLKCVRTTVVGMAGLILTLSFCCTSVAQQPSDDVDLKIGLSLAKMLQSARGVIGKYQSHINDPSIGDKGLSGDRVLAAALRRYLEKSGNQHPMKTKNSRQSLLMKAQMRAIREVMDENQTTINRAGVAFKGFIPAVFGWMVTERFRRYSGNLAVIKITAPSELVRNPNARPDRWESDVMENTFAASSWPKGKTVSATTRVNGRFAYRIAVPVYYGSACLSCHGTPKGELDRMGHPKEGAKLGQLGGAISITLFR